MATATAVQAVHDLFLYDLARIYETEREAGGPLLRVAKEIGDEQIRDALRHHEQETQQQLRNAVRLGPRPAPGPRERPAGPIQLGAGGSGTPIQPVVSVFPISPSPLIGA